MAKHNQYFCEHCGKHTLFIEDTPNHALHFILTLFTCGGWLIIWFFIAAGSKPWHCCSCGAKPSGSGWGIAGDIYRNIESISKKTGGKCEICDSISDDIEKIKGLPMCRACASVRKNK